MESLILVLLPFVVIGVVALQIGKKNAAKDLAKEVSPVESMQATLEYRHSGGNKHYMDVTVRFTPQQKEAISYIPNPERYLVFQVDSFNDRNHAEKSSLRAFMPQQLTLAYLDSGRTYSFQVESEHEARNLENGIRSALRDIKLVLDRAIEQRQEPAKKTFQV